MTRGDFLNEKLNYIYLTEDITKSIEKIDLNKLKVAAKSKNPKKALDALKSIPSSDIETLKTMGERKVKNFKRYYMEAESRLSDAPEETKKSFASLYAVMKSIGENTSEAGKAFARMAEKVLGYLYKYGGKIAWRSFNTGFVLFLLYLIFGLTTILGPLIYGGFHVAGIMFTVGLFFAILKLIINMMPRVK